MHALDLENVDRCGCYRPEYIFRFPIVEQFNTFYFACSESKISKHSAPLQIIDLVCCLPLPSAECTLMPPFIRKMSTSSTMKS